MFSEINLVLPTLQITTSDRSEPVLGSPFCGVKGKETYMLYSSEITFFFLTDASTSAPGYLIKYQVSDVGHIGK